MKIYNIGSLNIDYVYLVDTFVKPGETISSNSMQIHPGGKGLNQSIALARAGGKVIHCGSIGQDGEFLKNVLCDSNVDTTRIITLPDTTGHAIIQVDKSGQNCILLFAGANKKLNKEIIQSFLFDAEKNDILLLQNETNCLDEIFETAIKRNMQIAFNPSPFQREILGLPLECVKWWFCNEIEAGQLFGDGTPEEICNRFIKQYPESNLILTLGKEGAIFKNKDSYLRQPIFDVETVDTTAAGDTFTGYFLNAVAEGKSISFALKIASKASSITVSREGASSSIPFANDVVL